MAHVERADGAVVPHAFLPGSIIVKFRSGATQGTVLSAMRGVSGSSIERPSHADFEILTIPADADPEAVAAELRTQPDVEYAQPRYLNYPMMRPNDTFYDRQWNFPAIDMERAWDIQPQAGSEITVAVLDSGVAFRSATILYNSRFSFRLQAGGALSVSPEFPAAIATNTPRETA